MVSRVRFAGAVLLAELQCLAARIGYLVRPYDMIGDSRRWWFQRPQPCGRSALTPSERRSLADAARRDGVL